MKVRFETRPTRHIEYCCEEMKKAEKGRAILFPHSKDLSTYIFGPNNDPVVAKGPQPYEIHFCPFCGEKITFEEVKT